VRKVCSDLDFVCVVRWSGSFFEQLVISGGGNCGQSRNALGLGVDRTCRQVDRRLRDVVL
jgi:hypothetical protein